LNINLGDGTLLSPLKVFLVDFVWWTIALI
jgi:hypothetical protein